jgi:hypothetical protein
VRKYLRHAKCVSVGVRCWCLICVIRRNRRWGQSQNSSWRVTTTSVLLCVLFVLCLQRLLDAIGTSPAHETRHLRVDVVHSNILVLHQDLSLPWLGHRQVGPELQHLHAPGLLNDHSLHGAGDRGGRCHCLLSVVCCPLSGGGRAGCVWSVAAGWGPREML